MSPTEPGIKNDASPVGDDEILLRRCPSIDIWFSAGQPTPPLQVFLPNNGDPDGLSLYREGEPFISAEVLLAQSANENTRLYGGVVAIQAGNVRGEGITVRPEPDELPGHVLLPEMNKRDYDRDKNAMKTRADRLARKSDIRIRPKRRMTGSG